tara:strand:+ start:748 stop:1659 length:912 start_codon:yes stop_codon:yes gene_type:complete
MKALVTGAGGFVGKHLIEHLKESGDDVFGTDIVSGGPDLSDSVGLADLFHDVSPEVIFHLAGQADVGHSWNAVNETFRSNAEGTLNVLTAARSADIARIVTVTSADIYGIVSPEDLPLSEDAPFRPVSPYSASKASADLLALQAFLGHNQEVIRVRAFNHLGPGQSDKFVCSALAARIAHNELHGVSKLGVGNLAAKRDFTDVRDVVRAYRLLALTGKSGEAYNVCSGVSMSIERIASELLALSTMPMELVVDSDLLRPIDLPDLRGNPEKIARDTGWKPELTLNQTLTDLIGYWRLQLSLAE